MPEVKEGLRLKLGHGDGMGWMGGLKREPGKKEHMGIEG